jgi:hypothetical protein
MFQVPAPHKRMMVAEKNNARVLIALDYKRTLV